VSEVENSKEKSQISRRPNFWVEYFLTLAGGYLTGILAIITYEQNQLWLFAAIVSALCVTMVAALASSFERPQV
jgi:hypothetical protein